MFPFFYLFVFHLLQLSCVFVWIYKLRYSSVSIHFLFRRQMMHADVIFKAWFQWL